jgi:hypothetical protein
MEVVPVGVDNNRRGEFAAARRGITYGYATGLALKSVTTAYFAAAAATGTVATAASSVGGIGFCGAYDLCWVRWGESKVR